MSEESKVNLKTDRIFIPLENKVRIEATLVSIVLKAPAIEPDELKKIQIPEVDYTKGVVIDGRAPIWLYAFLVHKFHPALWVGTHDPRIGVVVVESHWSLLREGDVLKLKEDEKK